MANKPYWIPEDRIQQYLLNHPDVHPIGTNVAISESNFTLPLVYTQDKLTHVVYFEDDPWNEKTITRLVEWILALRFFSEHRGAKVVLTGVPTTDSVQEIISLEPVVIAKLAAILGMVMMDSNRPEDLVDVAERWLQELFGISLPKQDPPEKGLSIDQTVLLLHHLISEHFWAHNRWHFHPLEYVLLLGAAFGELIRLKYKGTWIPGEQPVDSQLRIQDKLNLSPFQAVLLMLEKGPDASIWETFQLIPIELESEGEESDGSQPMTH